MKGGGIIATTTATTSTLIEDYNKTKNFNKNGRAQALLARLGAWLRVEELAGYVLEALPVVLERF